jgi:cytochrome d ubiquinol oxidase subunit I
MQLDAELLARLQFAFTISFHIIFPSFTIGTAAFIATLLVRWNVTGQEHLHRLARFWTKIFAVSFAMGVVSGLVLSYQLGTNWSRYSTVVGNVIGPMLGYEVLMAFFLEASFLGVMLFGWKRVPPWLHTMSAIFVAAGTAISAFWILSANSWMQTPAGYEMRDGIAQPVDWLTVIFNPSFFYRLPHMLTAAYLTTSLVVLSVGARYVVAGRHWAEARTMLHMGIGMLAILGPLQIFIGDQHGLNTLKYQPAKIAAIEAHWDGSQPGELVLFGWPDAKTESNLYQIAIPHAGSLVLTHSYDGLFPGLKDFPKTDWPPLPWPFFAFRIMVGIGVLMALGGLVGAFLWWRGTLLDARWYLIPMSHAWWLGFVAVICGWIVTETGRQPWVAYGILRTAEAMSPVPASSVATTLALFVIVYGIVFASGIYYINRLIAKGPEGRASEAPETGTPVRPLSASTEAGAEAL